jgi:hypothetical protein
MERVYSDMRMFRIMGILLLLMCPLGGPFCLCLAFLGIMMLHAS